MASDLKYGPGSSLWKYWTKGAGLSKWSAATHKWTTLHRLLIEAGVPPSQADGLTTNIIEAVMPGYMKTAHAKKGRSSMTTSVTRSYALEDIQIRSGGDGRTVEAYAAVFDVPTEIHDQDGHYTEVIDRNAFNKTISERGRKFGVFFNHGMTLHGTPSERHSMPIGVPTEAPRIEPRGIVTVTHYHATPLADEVLEGIRSGAITGQSFSGRMLQSRSDARRPYRARNGELPTVTRTEIAMREYGPTPFPAYEDAEIMGVRAMMHAAYGRGAIDLDEFDELIPGASEDDLRDVLRDILSRLRPTATTPADEDDVVEQESGRSGTSDVEAAPDEPREPAHSGPATLTRARARAELFRREML